jgi:dephospho-CoA kinase
VPQAVSVKKKYLKIGLTGGFGTGKTTVARMFRELGAFVVDADRLAQGLLRQGSRQYDRIVRVFGEDILDRRGRIVRLRLARKVFGHPHRLLRLSRIIHPAVYRIIKSKFGRSRKPVRVAVVPLLFEASWEDRFDCRVVVIADRKNVLRRVKATRSMDEYDIKQRQRAQLPLALKVKRADFVIDNNGSLSRTREQVKVVWKRLEFDSKLK